MPDPAPRAAESAEDASLRITLDFKPGTPDLKKAEMALEVFDLTARMLESISAQADVEWRAGRGAFTGDDAAAQPIYEALVRAYNRGRAAAALRGEGGAGGG